MDISISYEMHGDKKKCISNQLYIKLNNVGKISFRGVFSTTWHTVWENSLIGTPWGWEQRPNVLEAGFQMKMILEIRVWYMLDAGFQTKIVLGAILQYVSDPCFQIEYVLVSSVYEISQASFQTLMKLAAFFQLKVGCGFQTKSKVQSVVHIYPTRVSSLWTISELASTKNWKHVFIWSLKWKPECT